MKNLITIILFVIPFHLLSHPSWGIAADSKGMIYFVDVMHDDGTLWKYNPETGKTSALISRHFHAHGMHMGDDDILYIATQIWIDGEIMGDGHNYFFRYDTKTDKLDTLLFSTDYDEFFGGEGIFDLPRNRVLFFHNGLLKAYSFDDKKATIVSTHEFTRKCTMFKDDDGAVFISDSRAKGGSIWKWEWQKGVQLVASNLMNPKPEKPVFKEERFWLFCGMGVSRAGNLIYSENADRQLVELDEDGNKKVIYQSPEHYQPTGVVFSKGKYYVTEVGYLPGTGHVGPEVKVIKG